MRLFTINVILAFVSITKSQINFNGPSNNRRVGASASVNVEARAISNSRGRGSASVSGAFSTQSGSNKNNFNFDDIFPRLIRNSKKRCNRSLYETLENRVRTTNDLVS